MAQDAVLREAGVGGELEAAADDREPGIDVARKHDDRRGKLATQQAQVSFILVRACLLEQILQKREVPCGQSATGRSGHGKPPSRPNTGSGALKVGSIVLEDRPLARPRGSRTPGQGLSACDEVTRAALRADRNSTRLNSRPYF